MIGPPRGYGGYIYGEQVLNNFFIIFYMLALSDNLICLFHFSLPLLIRKREEIFLCKKLKTPINLGIRVLNIIVRLNRMSVKKHCLSRDSQDSVFRNRYKGFIDFTNHSSREFIYVFIASNAISYAFLSMFFSMVLRFLEVLIESLYCSRSSVSSGFNVRVLSSFMLKPYN